jgi:hypothetical protein
VNIPKTVKSVGRKALGRAMVDSLERRANGQVGHKVGSNPMEGMAWAAPCIEVRILF